MVGIVNGNPDGLHLLKKTQSQLSTTLAMQTRSKTRSKVQIQKAPPKVHKVAKAKAKPKKYLLKLGIPEAKAARMRLYKVVRRGHGGNPHFVRNAEGLDFNMPDNDTLFIGDFTSTIEITPTDMAYKLDGIGGFFHISFFKADETLREMYAHVHSREQAGGLLKLRDLERPMDELRSCRMERVVSLIHRGKRFVVGSKIDF